MKSDMKFFIALAVSFLPFILFAFINSKVNVKKEKESRLTLFFYLSKISIFKHKKRRENFSRSFYFTILYIPKQLRLYN